MQIEAMKMLSTIAAPCDGQITKLFVAAEQNVQPDQLLLRYSCRACDS